MSDPEDYVQHVLAHYKQEAQQSGTSEASTMWDKTTRRRELDAIVRLLRYVGSAGVERLRLLEVGCGNGVLLNHLNELFPNLAPTGLEFSEDMLALARARELPKATLLQGDVRRCPFPDGELDVVVSERCVINLMNKAHQAEAFAEIARVLKRGGHYICVEAFTDGHRNMNGAREELGLPPIPQAHHNLWFDKTWFQEELSRYFEFIPLAGKPELPSENFLSSHYFVSRVLYPSLTKREVLYNTSFVEFFDFLPPSGNFSPIQLHLLKKR